MSLESDTDRNRTPFALAVAALGVVYGDIGTSPLYALRECFTRAHGIRVTRAQRLGVLSLIFWSLMLIVSVKYLIYVLRADNKGEGGILALMTLASSKTARAARHAVLIASRACSARRSSTATA